MFTFWIGVILFDVDALTLVCGDCMGCGNMHALTLKHHFKQPILSMYIFSANMSIYFGRD